MIKLLLLYRLTNILLMKESSLAELNLKKNYLPDDALCSVNFNMMKIIIEVDIHYFRLMLSDSDIEHLPVVHLTMGTIHCSKSWPIGNGLYFCRVKTTFRLQ